MVINIVTRPVNFVSRTKKLDQDIADAQAALAAAVAKKDDWLRKTTKL